MASSIAKSAAQQVGNLLVEEAKFLYKVQGKIESLQAELEWMECFLEDADNRQHTEKLVRKWVTQITDFAYEAEDIIERYVHEVSINHRRDGIWDTMKWFSSVLCAFQAYTLHNLGSDVDELTLKVSDLTSRLQRYGVQLIRPTESLAYNAMMREERRTYSHVEEEVVGLEKHVHQVVDQLINTRVNVVSISGMGGLGKSTLARRVFVDKSIKEHFRNNCVWVYIAKEFSRRNVFEEILIGLSVSGKDENARKEIKDVTETQLAEQIYELLRNTKCFVVLDDIWTTEAWVSLKPALGSIESSPSKILISTRNQELLQYVDCNGYSHCLEALDDDNSWKLLQLKAFPQKWSPVDAEEKTKKEKLGREMLKHCHGLPLAIIVLGGILSSKRTLSEWEEVQKNISAHLMTTNLGDGRKTGGVLPVLELSYHDLPFHLKPCFLYLGIFPEDYEISTQRLYQLWEAEGILAIPTKDETEVVEGVTTSFEIGERHLLGLIQRSMVQVGTRWEASGRIKTCRVHDLMRDMCIRKCKEASFFTVQEITQSGLSSSFDDGCVVRKNMRRCAFHVKEGSVESHFAGQHGEKGATCVRSLLVFPLKESRTIYISKDGFKNMVERFPLLRVLDLQDIDSIRSTIVGFGHLIHLRYLNLRKVRMRKMSSNILDLKYLVTLDLRSYYQIMLPAKFHRMERLRHLYLPSFFDVEGGKRLTFRNDRMETLKNFHPEKCQMEDLLQMTRLRIFSISPSYWFESGDVLKVLAESPVIKSGHLVNSLRLGIMAEVIEEDPTILTSLFKDSPCFFKLRLQGRGSGEPYPRIENACSIESGIEVFPRSLTQLEITSCKLGREVRLVLKKLPHLERLQLYSVSMEEYNTLTFSPGSFPQLKYLRITNPWELGELDVEDGALPNLQHLLLIACEKLKKLPDGLPDSVSIECCGPCIKGIEKYNTCPHFKSHTSSSS